MVYVGIDVAKDKHTCCILNENGVPLGKPFEIPNNRRGFETLAAAIERNIADPTRAADSPNSSGAVPLRAADSPPVRIALESTGHYAANLLNWLLARGYPTCLLNPLLTAQYHRSRTLRKTKTDRADSRVIAEILLRNPDLPTCNRDTLAREELKTLTRYRHDKVEERARLKNTVARLVNLLFPELETTVSDLHLTSIHTLLEQYPGAAPIAAADPDTIQTLLKQTSHGHIGPKQSDAILTAARGSIATDHPAASVELRHTIAQIRSKTREIDEIETMIREHMAHIPNHLTTVPGIGPMTAAVIIAELGDFRRFAGPDKILAYAGLSPTVYQSGKIDSPYAHMDKQGSRYLRHALYTAAKYACKYDQTYRTYLAKKLAEGKHYNVAVSHAAKKLVRLLYSMEIHDRPYTPSKN